MTLCEAKQRMKSRKFGVFNHFLGGDSDSAEWNGLVDGFDVERVAEDLHNIGAGYYFITLMQGWKTMCAPNATFDAIAGTKPGEACANRDLVADLYDALSKYDIDLYLYFTGDGPYKNEELGAKFGFTEPRKNVTLAFAERWASVLEEYALRYGDKVKGWWIDGCYDDDFGYDNEKLTPYYNAVKKGNPSALVTMNNGVRSALYRYYEREDFTAGEFTDFTYIPDGVDIGDSVPHILAPLGVAPDGVEWNSWCKPGCKRDGRYLREYIRQVNAKGGGGDGGYSHSSRQHL